MKKTEMSYLNRNFVYVNYEIKIVKVFKTQHQLHCIPKKKTLSSDALFRALPVFLAFSFSTSLSALRRGSMFFFIVLRAGKGFCYT